MCGPHPGSGGDPAGHQHGCADRGIVTDARQADGGHDHGEPGAKLGGANLAEEVEAFLAAEWLPNYRRTAWCLALGTGLRRAELCGLEWRDLDFDGQTLTVERTRTPVGHKVIEGAPKTARGYRTMSISVGLVTVLRRWKVAQGELMLATGRPQRQVLTNDRLTPWHPNNRSVTLRLPRSRSHRRRAGFRRGRAG